MADVGSAGGNAFRGGSPVAALAALAVLCRVVGLEVEYNAPNHWVVVAAENLRTFCCKVLTTCLFYVIGSHNLL